MMERRENWAERVQNWGKRALSWFKDWKIQTEPIIFILSLCNVARAVVSPHLMDAKVRRVYTHPPGMTEKAIKKFYSKKMTIWSQNYEYVNLPIACIAGIVWGSFSDRKGRKTPLLVSLVSVIIDNSFYMLVWAEKTDIALQWLFLAAVVVGLLGDFMLLMSCVNAYLADTFGNKRELSVRMIIVSTIFSLGSLCGSQLVQHVVTHIGHVGTLFVVQGTLLATFVLSFFILDNKRPTEECDPEAASIANGGASEAALETTQKSLWLSVRDKFKYLYDALHIFFVNREGHRRAFLYLCFLANFIDQLVFGEEKGLIGIYTKLDPFDWDTNEYATYKTWRPIVQIIGMIFGLIVLKKALKLRDTFIIVLAIGSMSLCTLVIGLAQSSALIYASLLPGSLHGLLNPLTYTFITCLVAPNEIGQTFAVSTIAGKLAGLVQSAALHSIYIATVDWYQGFVWLLMCGLSAIAAVVYLGVHFVAKKENIGA